MFRDRWLPEFTAAGVQTRECPLLVGSHHQAITDNIGREDGGKTALDVLFCHATTRCLAHGECTVTSFECLRRTRKVWFWSFSTDPAVCLRVDVRLAARATFARKPTSPFKPAKRELESRAASSLTMRGMPSSDAPEPAA